MFTVRYELGTHYAVGPSNIELHILSQVPRGTRNNRHFNGFWPCKIILQMTGSFQITGLSGRLRELQHTVTWYRDRPFHSEREKKLELYARGLLVCRISCTRISHAKTLHWRCWPWHWALEIQVNYPSIRGPGSWLINRIRLDPSISNRCITSQVHTLCMSPFTPVTH